MKKTSKPTAKKPAQKKPATKKSSSKPKRKTQGQSELVEIVARLAAITEKLAQTAERLAPLPTRPSHVEETPRVAGPQQHPENIDQEAADVTSPPIAPGEGADPDNATAEQ